MKITGRVWKFGDDINTDLMLPNDAMLLPREEQTRYCMSANRPGWVDQVEPGDIIVGGRNFGTGSSRAAARVLKDLKLSALLADNINGLFFRNCVNYAFPALELPGISAMVDEGDVVEIDFDNAIVTNLRTGESLQGTPWPGMLRKILDAGGIIATLEAENLIRPREAS